MLLGAHMKYIPDFVRFPLYVNVYSYILYKTSKKELTNQQIMFADYIVFIYQLKLGTNNVTELRDDCLAHIYTLISKILPTPVAH
jgi:hypothetical protein